jgi:Xaa-Pro aminopeptidase
MRPWTALRPYGPGANDRLSKVQTLLGSQKLNALLLSAEPNISYLTGFPAPDSYLLIAGKGMKLFTDFRYAADFEKKAGPGLTVIQYKGPLFKTLAKTIEQEGGGRVGFESRHLPFAEYEALRRSIRRSITLLPLKESVERLREIKEPRELNAIRKAVAITLEAFRFVEKALKPGISELACVAEIERFVRLRGASGSAFSIIVASGPNASYPHARASLKKLKKGEAIVIDMGVEWDSYKSDLTRTFFLGRIRASVRRAHEAVREAQERAIAAIQPGITIKKIDSLARNTIKEKGFGKYFGHALGHGVGLEVHESPAINGKNANALEPGMVFTVEPGIYKPGEFGIRLEEMVLVTDSGVEVLSGTDRDQSA